MLYLFIFSALNVNHTIFRVICVPIFQVLTIWPISFTAANKYFVLTL